MLLVVLPIVLVLPASVARAAFGSAARFASPTAVVGAIHALRPSVFATHARSTQAASGVLDKRDERVSCFLSGDETYLSGVVSAGGKWFAASPRGLFTSTDGRTFVLSTQSMPLAPHGIGATTDSVWVWSKSEFRRGATKSVTRFPMAAGAAPVVLETPVFVDSDRGALNRSTPYERLSRPKGPRGVSDVAVEQEAPPSRGGRGHAEAG